MKAYILKKYYISGGEAKHKIVSVFTSLKGVIREKNKRNNVVKETVFTSCYYDYETTNLKE